MDFFDWFSGFATGEAWFSIRRAGKKNAQAQYTSYACIFGINLRDDDESILIEIQRELGFGRLGCRHQKSHTLNANPQVTFEVARIEDCVKLVTVFEQHPPKGKKLESFKLWATAVRHMAEHSGVNQFRSTVDKAYMEQLKEDMHYVNMYRPRPLVMPTNVVASYHRTCPGCGGEFLTTKPQQRWCWGGQCGKNDYMRRKRAIPEYRRALLDKQSVIRKQQREEHGEEVRAQRRAYYAANREQILAQQAEYKKRKRELLQR